MKLAWIGTGRIVHDSLYAVTPLTQIEKAAIYARPHSRKTAEELAAQYGIREIYTDYTELLEKTDADTVYIGLVNSAHFSYAEQALAHGKNVILEKPFVPTLREAQRLAALAREKGCMLMEAITVLHLPVFSKMRENLPKLGQLRAMQLNFSQYSSRYDRYLQGDVDYCFDPAYQGGALFDLNVYNVHYCAGLFGMPRSVSYFPNIGHNGVDTSGQLVLRYDGFSAVCLAAKDSDSPGHVTIQGERGFMIAEGCPNSAGKLTVTAVCGGAAQERSASGATVRKTETECFTAPEVLHRMTWEFKRFAEIVDKNERDTADWLLSESLQVVEILELARKSAPEMW